MGILSPSRLHTALALTVFVGAANMVMGATARMSEMVLVKSMFANWSVVDVRVLVGSFKSRNVLNVPVQQNLLKPETGNGKETQKQMSTDEKEKKETVSSRYYSR